MLLYQLPIHGLLLSRNLKLTSVLGLSFSLVLSYQKVIQKIIFYLLNDRKVGHLFMELGIQIGPMRKLK